MDLISIAVEGFIRETPDSIRCGVVNAVMSLPFDTEYKLKETKVRRRTDCMVADRVGGEKAPPFMSRSAQ
jgi:hypothetical protein